MAPPPEERGMNHTKHKKAAEGMRQSLRSLLIDLRSKDGPVEIFGQSIQIPYGKFDLGINTVPIDHMEGGDRRHS